MIIKHDKKYNFKSMFEPTTGFYMRTGILDENNNDTGIEPFQASFPELIDVGIMQTCVCSHKCTVDCYQKASTRSGKNMSIEDFEKICKQCEGKCFSFALGGAGDVDAHENFEDILKLCRQYNIVPNFTTSGILMNKNKAEICKKYCGAVAVSQHSKLRKVIIYKEKNNEIVKKYTNTFLDVNELLCNDWYLTDKIKNDDKYTYKEVYFEEDGYTYRAIQTLLNAGVKTNIHYVLSNKTIDEAIIRLENNAFPDGINAVVFLLYKPVGFGKQENVLNVNDYKVKYFFELVNKNNYSFKVGFDSCTCAGLLNFNETIDLNSVDYCEGARFSAYIDANLNMMPCSFANQDTNWHINLNEYTIQEVWNSELFDAFRHSLKTSCKKCKNRNFCGGGCPLINEITLCNKKEKDFVEPTRKEITYG